MGVPPGFSLQAGLPPELIGIDGPRLLQRIQQFSGKGVLVNTWASWCGSCAAEMPMLLEVRAEYEPQGIAVWFVSVDEPKKAGEAVTFLQQHEIEAPSFLVRGQLEPFKRAMSPLWRGSLPATFLFDSTGKLRYFWGAQVYREELTPVLDGFLRGEPIDGAANFSVRKGRGAPP